MNVENVDYFISFPRQTESLEHEVGRTRDGKPVE